MSTLSDNLLHFVKTLEYPDNLSQIPFKYVGLSKLNQIGQAMANTNLQLDAAIVGSRRHSLFSNNTLTSLLQLKESLKRDTPDQNNPSVYFSHSTLTKKLAFAIETITSLEDKSSPFSGKLNKVMSSLISEDFNLNTKVPRSRRHSLLIDLENSLSSLRDLKEAIHPHPNTNSTRKSSTISDNLIEVQQPPSEDQEIISFTRRLRRSVQELVSHEELLNLDTFESFDVPNVLDDSSHHVLQHRVCIDDDDIPSDEDALLLQDQGGGWRLETLLDSDGSASKELCAVNLPPAESAPTQPVSLCSFSVFIKMVQISTTLTIVCTNFYTDGISTLIKSLSVQTFTNIVYASTMVSTLSILLMNVCRNKPPVILVRVLNTIGAILFFTAGVANLFQWQLYFKQVAVFNFKGVADVIVNNITSPSKTRLDFVIPLIHVGTSDMRHYIVLGEGVLSVLNALFYTVDVVVSVTQAVAKKLPYLPLSRRGSSETLTPDS